MTEESGDLLITAFVPARGGTQVVSSTLQRVGGFAQRADRGLLDRVEQAGDELAQPTVRMPTELHRSGGPAALIDKLGDLVDTAGVPT
ncbi:hypothetical protein GCM10029963_17420 [Micromonospora andamanensis]